MKSIHWPVFVSFLLLLCSGCTHVISTEGRAKVDREVALSEVFAEPAAHLGTRLLTGGLILSASEDEMTSTLEVLVFRLDRGGEPIDIDPDGARFLARTADKLDPERYVPGQLVTLTGTVAGSEDVELPGRVYTFPLLLIHEIHLWEEPFRRGLLPGQDPRAPFYERPEQLEGHENPYDPGYAPYPYTPYYYRVR